ncbi:MAG: efflux RND transporter periplasmic adaptor subunit [Saprospiraceae bacterium]|nr:efflux RND transporter periplasmic adaptor subunit [Saprospiraceae bacterium]
MNLQTRRTLISASFLLLIILSVFVTRRMRANAAQASAENEIVVEQPTRKVRVMKAKNATHTLHKEVSGILVARDRYTVYSEVAGRMLSTKPAFRRGAYFPRGAAILHLDDETDQIRLTAQKNQLYNTMAAAIPDLTLDYGDAVGAWETYVRSFDGQSTLEELPEVHEEKLKLFISARGIYQQFYQIRAEEKRLSKFTLHTPISGILTEAIVLPGSYVQPGQRLGEITGSNRFEMEMTIQPEELVHVERGKEVIITTQSHADPYVGKISKINPVVDDRTQSVTVIVEVTGKDLFHGMYVEGKFRTKNVEQSMSLDRNLLLPDNHVYVVQGDTLAKIPTTVVGSANGVAYLKGLPDGVLLLNETSPTFSSGMKVIYEVQAQE